MKVKIWTDFLGDVEIEYDEKKYYKEWKRQHIIPRNEFMHLKEIFPLIMLRQSLFMDGRFYGAEWEEEYDYPLQKLEGILAPYITEYEDPVEAVRRVRESYLDESS